jgi:biopolymer transport protein ExbD
MDLIPDEELKPKGLMNLTPMVDFLFLVIAIFATLALTRTALFDSEVNLASVKEESLLSSPLANSNYTVILGVTKEGSYKWLTEFNEYAMEGISPILNELANQTELGLLPQEAEKTKILLHVDKNAEWEPIVQLIYSLKKTGYTVHPVYEKNSG